MLKAEQVCKYNGWQADRLFTQLTV